MRKLFILFTLCASAFLFSGLLQAQEEDNRYFAIVDYMYVEPGMHAEYMACENTWKIMHQELVKSGEIEGWEVEQVVYSGVNTDYNYMTITVVKGWAAIERNGFDFEKLAASVPADQRKYIENPDDYRTWVRSEIWSIQDRVFADNEARPLYRVENFCDLPSVPGTWNNYMTMEQEFAKPVIEERIRTGKQAGWVLGSLYRSRGTAYPYHVSTLDFFNSWEDIAAADNTSWEKVYPDMTDAQISEKIYSVKIPVRTEIRRLVLHTD